MDHGVTFSYSRESGSSVSLQDGTIVYDDTCTGVPMLSGFCKSDNAWKPNKRTETLATSSAADFVCSPCGQATPEPWSKGSINATVAPAMATKTTGTDGEPWSGRPPTPTRKPIIPRSTSARGRRQLCPERQRDGTTPKLTLPEDEAIGNRHGASARSVSATQSSGNAGTNATYLHLVSGPFLIEVFSGSGRMAQAAVPYTHLRAHETRHDLVCSLLLENKKKKEK